MCATFQHIEHLLRLCREMIILTDEAHRDPLDDGCRLLFSMVQDSAYKLRNQAARELQTHRRAAGSRQEADPYQLTERLVMRCDRPCGTEAKITTEERLILTALASAGAAAVTARELAAPSGLDPELVLRTLVTLRAKGYATCPARCRHAITETGISALYPK